MTDQHEVLEGSAAARDETPPTEGPDDAITGVHPLAWVAGGLLAAGVFFQIVGTKYLIGNLSGWHWVSLVVLLAVALKPIVLHKLRLAIEVLPAITGVAAWILAWVVFFVQFFNVVTRYGNDLVERDILYGQATSIAWQSFALLFLLGINYGVKAGINPRIDFWWADFSNTRKAWLDFVLHIALLLPFIIMSIRILRPYAAISLGRKRDGSWPSGWRVWNTWEESGDADQLGVGPIKAMLLVAFILFGIQIFAEVIKTGFVIMGHNRLGDVKDHDAPLRVE
ncbi:MAG: TRAP transporter small permease subunit [Acidimicrobiales bacterium]